MRPILVPNANCLPDPSMFVGQQAVLRVDNDYDSRVIFDMNNIADDNSDYAHGPVIHVPNTSDETLGEFYNPSDDDMSAICKIAPITAIDLSTNQVYFLSEGTWFGPVSENPGMSFQESIIYMFTNFFTMPSRVEPIPNFVPAAGND